jgi:acetyl esterase
MIDPAAPIDELEPGVRQFHARTSADYAAFAVAGDDSIATRRAVAERVRAPWREGGPAMAQTIDLTAGVNRIRIHRPVADAVLPVLVYLHGGGWTLFSLDTHDRLMREYAARSGCAVLGLDYSLVPEARFPVALGEIAALLGWIGREGAAYRLDPSRIAIGGDSAGANLALAGALDSPGRLAGLLLNYGVFDTRQRPSWDRYDGPDYMLTAQEMRDFWTGYLGGDVHTDNARARPLLADLRGLPPVFQCIAQCDILADENCELTQRLRAASVAVEAQIYPGATHSFLEAMSISPLADRALGDAAQWLRRQLQP